MDVNREVKLFVEIQIKKNIYLFFFWGGGGGGGSGLGGGRLGGGVRVDVKREVKFL